MYFTQQDGTFQLFDGDKIAVLAALLVRDILNDLQLPTESIKVSLSCLSFPSCLWSRLIARHSPASLSLAKPEAIVSTVRISCWMPLLSCNVFTRSKCLLYLFHISPHADMCSTLQMQLLACCTATLMTTCGSSLVYCAACPTMTSASNRPADVSVHTLHCFGPRSPVQLWSWDHDVPCDFGIFPRCQKCFTLLLAGGHSADSVCQWGIHSVHARQSGH